MASSVYINLHCHSTFSDGAFTPEELAQKLAQAGVEYAALTDHDAIEGTTRFHEALKRYNIGFLSGVEITTVYRGQEVHLLGYGIDLHHERLNATLAHLNYKNHSRIQGPLRRLTNPLSSKTNRRTCAGCGGNRQYRHGSGC